MAEGENKLVELMKFFKMTSRELKAEWDRLSEEEKHWFKTQPLK